MIALVSSQCSSDDVAKCNTIENELVKKWPQNADEVKTQCDNFFVKGKCLRDLVSVCLKPNEQSLINQILDPKIDVLSKLCSTGVDQFLKDIHDCFNKNEVNSGLEYIHNRYVALMKAADTFDKSTYQQSFCCTQLFRLEQIYALHSEQCNNEIADRHKAIATNSVSISSLFQTILITFSLCM